MDKLLVLYSDLRKRCHNERRRTKEVLSHSGHNRRSPWHLAYSPYQWGKRGFEHAIPDTMLDGSGSHGMTSKIIQKTLEKCGTHSFLCRLSSRLTRKKCSSEQTKSSDSNVMLISMRHNMVIETSYNSVGAKYKSPGSPPGPRSTAGRQGGRERKREHDSTWGSSQEQLLLNRRHRQQSRQARERRKLYTEDIPCPSSGTSRQSADKAGARERRKLYTEDIPCPSSGTSRQSADKAGARERRKLYTEDIPCPRSGTSRQSADKAGARERRKLYTEDIPCPSSGTSRQSADKAGARERRKLYTEDITCPSSGTSQQSADKAGARLCRYGPGARQSPDRPRQLMKHVHTTIVFQKRRLRNNLYFLGSTMLQQILRDMYVDPELLAELDEEQKQILFCKMREEQVRRWRERETALETQERNKSPRVKKPGGKCVGFMSGCDGKPWVWVMGEHKGDRSIEEIIETEQQSRASKMAEEEAELLRKKMEEELRLKMQEEEEKLREEMRRKEEMQRKKAEEEVRLKIEEEMKLEDDRQQKKERERKELEEERKRTEQGDSHREGKEEEGEVFSPGSHGEEGGSMDQRKDRNKEYDTLKKLHELKVRTERRRRSSLRQIETLREQRKSQLYLSFREARSKIAQLAEKDSRHLQEEWELQERRARVRETEMRDIARRARQEHSVCSRNMKTESQLIDTSLDFNIDPTTNATSTVPTSHPSPQTVWPAKPANREAVITWFHESERPRGVGINPITQQPLPWFHGIIVRKQAEELLVDRPLGSFLVRVSERVRGYAISYRASDRCKHYLIDTLDGHYQFFGANQVVHNSLADLVCFHKKAHITKLGEELLLYPCGQNTDPPDYADLFAGQLESSRL